MIVPGHFAYAGLLKQGRLDGWGVRFSLMPSKEASYRRRIWLGSFRAGHLTRGGVQYQASQPGVSSSGRSTYIGQMHAGLPEGEGRLSTQFPFLNAEKKRVAEEGKFVAGQLIDGIRRCKVHSTVTTVSVKGGTEQDDPRSKTEVSSLRVGDLVELNGEVAAVAARREHLGDIGGVYLSNGQVLRARWNYSVPVVGRDHPKAAGALADAARFEEDLVARETAEADAAHAAHLAKQAQQQQRAANLAARAEQSRGLRYRNTSQRLSQEAQNWNNYETRTRGGANLGWYNESRRY